MMIRCCKANRRKIGIVDVFVTRILGWGVTDRKCKRQTDGVRQSLGFEHTVERSQVYSG
jgi:hypothetical protein